MERLGGRSWFWPAEHRPWRGRQHPILVAGQSMSGNLLSVEHKEFQPGFLGNLLCLELGAGEEHLYVYRALYRLPQVSDKTRLPILQLGMRPVGLIIAEVSYMFKMSPAVHNAGSPGESPFSETPPSSLLGLHLEVLLRSEVLF